MRDPIRERFGEDVGRFIDKTSGKGSSLEKFPPRATMLYWLTLVLSPLVGVLLGLYAPRAIPLLAVWWLIIFIIAMLERSE